MTSVGPLFAALAYADAIAARRTAIYARDLYEAEAKRQREFKQAQQKAQAQQQPAQGE